MHEEISHHTPKIILRRSDISAGRPAKPNISLMEQVRNNLTFSLQELQRMEDEGGSDVTPEQAEEIQKLSESINRLDALMPSWRQDFNAGLIPNHQPKEKRDE